MVGRYQHIAKWTLAAPQINKISKDPSATKHVPNNYTFCDKTQDRRIKRINSPLPITQVEAVAAQKASTSDTLDRLPSIKTPSSSPFPRIHLIRPASSAQYAFLSSTSSCREPGGWKRCRTSGSPSLGWCLLWTVVFQLSSRDNWGGHPSSTNGTRSDRGRWAAFPESRFSLQRE